MQIPESEIFQTEREPKWNFIQEGFNQGEGSEEAQLPNEIQQNANILGSPVLCGPRRHRPSQFTAWVYDKL